MTGYYPFRLGMQVGTVQLAWSFPCDPEKLVSMHTLQQEPRRLKLKKSQNKRPMDLDVLLAR